MTLDAGAAPLLLLVLAPTALRRLRRAGWWTTGMAYVFAVGVLFWPPLGGRYLRRMR